MIETAQLHPMKIDLQQVQGFDKKGFKQAQLEAIKALDGQSFDHKWQLAQRLAQQSETWQLRQESPQHKAHNSNVKSQLAYVQRFFHLADAAVEAVIEDVEEDIF